MKNRSTPAGDPDPAAIISLAKSFKIGDRVHHKNSTGLTGTVYEIDFRLATPQIWVILDNFEGREVHPPLPYLPSDLIKIEESEPTEDDTANTQISALAPQGAFDYSVLDTENLAVIRFHTEAIKERIRRTAQDIIEIGERLLDVKQRLPHGQFGLWLLFEFGWDERTAQRFMSVSAMFKNDKLSDLSKAALDKASIDQSALYLLAAKSTPQEVRHEVLERACLGETISHAKVKQILKASRPAKKPSFRHSNIKSGDLVEIKCDKDVEMEYRRWNGCWAAVQSVAQSSSGVKVIVAGNSMKFHKNDLRLIENPSPDFREIALQVNELLARSDLDSFDREILGLYLRRKNFTDRAREVLVNLKQRYA